MKYQRKPSKKGFLGGNKMRPLILADLIDEEHAFSKYAQETLQEVAV
jgi:hypothetical protein